MENGSGLTLLPLQGWASDDWIGRRAVGVVIARSDGTVQFKAYVPDFLPGNHLKVTVNGSTAFEGDIPAGEEHTFSAPVTAGTNNITVACSRAASPAALGVGKDQRSLGVRLTLVSTPSQ